MSRTKLEDIVSYVETKLNTVSNLDTVKYTDSDNEPIPVKTYGAQIYFDPTNFFNQEFQYIGKFATEFWKLKVDIIINKRFKDRESVSNSLGVSYWIDTIRALFEFGQNVTMFRNSWWELESLDPKSSTDGYLLKGVFQCEILNNYN